jgi:hypothetical protein
VGIVGHTPNTPQCDIGREHRVGVIQKIREIRLRSPIVDIFGETIAALTIATLIVSALTMSALTMSARTVYAPIVATQTVFALTNATVVAAHTIAIVRVLNGRNGIEMSYIARRVNPRVGASGAGQLDRFAKQPRQNLLDGLLHRGGVRLPLPPVVARAEV